MVGVLPQPFQYLAGMAKVRKVTVRVPSGLLEAACRATGEGTSRTAALGLELLLARAACRSLRALRGKVRFSLDLAELREDRSFS